MFFFYLICREAGYALLSPRELKKKYSWFSFFFFFFLMPGATGLDGISIFGTVYGFSFYFIIHLRIHIESVNQDGSYIKTGYVLERKYKLQQHGPLTYELSLWIVCSSWVWWACTSSGLGQGSQPPALKSLEVFKEMQEKWSQNAMFHTVSYYCKLWQRRKKWPPSALRRTRRSVPQIWKPEGSVSSHSWETKVVISKKKVDDGLYRSGGWASNSWFHLRSRSRGSWVWAPCGTLCL